MTIAEELDQFIREKGNDVFIEVEGTSTRISNFCQNYNHEYNCDIDNETDGVIDLGDNQNKWGIELRLYLNDNPNINNLTVTRNNVYRSDYAYRINDNNIIQDMFNLEYRIGLNHF